ncbi:Vacuolar ABC heavy metal transporter (H.t1.c1) [Penicillium subrubescens]|uniref:Vacuolar ABC heavy metal transporter (H.t1.c1) n=1 Tax=Penicillium subrubescens TaxID=1316194 RepID=UPI00254558EE|nr:Vacuolar ABC heavy metal transporter (H.t1.c1) [Penicillium subrubescens]KAJ5873636.1 Vacuolar ABC heavy metal transporter (H.t1.c1) [Penicillium subrubescens]
MEQRIARELLESLQTLHTFSPILLFTLFIGAHTATIITRTNRPKNGQSFSPTQKRLFNWLSAVLLVTYFEDAAVSVAHVVIAQSEQWWCGQSVVVRMHGPRYILRSSKLTLQVYITGSSFFYMILLVSMFDTTSSPTAVHLTCWSAAIPIEMLILSISLVFYCSVHPEKVVGDPFGGPIRQSITLWEIEEVATRSARILTLIALVLLYARKSRILETDVESSNEATETTRLLNSSRVGNHYQYDNPKNRDPLRATSQAHGLTLQQTTTGSWWEYISDYSIFLPFMWPSKSYRLKLVTVACFFLLVIQRINNVMAPNQVGVVITALANQQGHSPWPQIILFVVYRWLQTSLSSLRSALWVPVSQYCRMELSMAAFEHVHSLDLDFHLNKKTGEVLSAFNKGKPVVGLLEQVVFELIPTLFDLLIAIGYFLIFFDAYYALVVGISSFSYIYVTFRVGPLRAQTRREMMKASRYEEAIKNESIVSYLTVKLFNQETYELGRYRTAIGDHQSTERRSFLCMTIFNTVQNTILMTGLLCTCLIAAFQISTVQRPVGLFVTLLTYMAQLQGPLASFGSFYGSIQSALIAAEHMLGLFREQSKEVDSPLAIPLTTCNGEIQFQDVGFCYDERKVVLDGLTFTCKPGTTTAIVGESGVGKSTIFQILYRFYNPVSGCVYIDGHPIRDLTGDSIRRNISVVPQESRLFNESLMYNLKYANQSATDEEIYQACRDAGIHDKIMAFPDGYDSKVGDQGLRLSGGEKQRVAIACAILKNTPIILLDEATSALDTNSEAYIQRSLKALSHDRTILVIAHRLSTITAADCILVMHEGHVVERGTHAELLELGGRYRRMWQNQSEESA